MPNITIPALSNFSAFKTIIQSGEIDEIKSLLIQTVTQMKDSRWAWGYHLSSTCKIVESNAENDLLKALHTSNHMDNVKEALRNYKHKFSGVQHQIDMGSNTAAFMKGIEPLVGQVPVSKTFAAEYTPAMFTRFLQETRKYNEGIPFNVMIHYRDHVAIIGFDGNKWLVADRKTTDTVILYDFIYRQSDDYKDKNGRVMAQVEFTSNEHSLNIDYHDIAYKDI